MATVSFNLPDIREKDMQDSQKIDRIMSYLYQLNEQLRYQLTHIDEENMAGDGLTAAALSPSALRAIIHEQLGKESIDISGNTEIVTIYNDLSALRSTIQSNVQAVENLRAMIRQDEASIGALQRALAEKAAQSTVDALSGTVGTLSTTVSTLSGTVSTMSGTVGTLSTTVSTLGGSVTALGNLVTDVSGNLADLTAAYNNHKHSFSVNQSTGAVTIGGPTATAGNFNIADTKFYKDKVAAERNNVRILEEDITISDARYYASEKKYYLDIYAETIWGNGTTATGVELDASAAWNAGKNSVTISNGDIVRDGEDDYNQNTHETIIYIEATASNGAQGTARFTVDGANAYNAGKGDATVTSMSAGGEPTSSGRYYSIPIKATMNNGKEKTLNVLIQKSRFPS